MTDLVTPRTLGDLADQPGANPAILISGSEAVVLGRTTSGDIAVYRAGAIAEYAPTMPVITIVSAEDRLDVLEKAVRDLSTWRNAAVATAQELRAVLPRIRAYAIERHQDGDICRDGLNRFLREFDLPEYEPSMTVHYTITGSFRLDGNDEDHARQHVDDLRVELPYATNIIESSSDYDVSLDEIQHDDGSEDAL